MDTDMLLIHQFTLLSCNLLCKLLNHAHGSSAAFEIFGLQCRTQISEEWPDETSCFLVPQEWEKYTEVWYRRI